MNIYNIDQYLTSYSRPFYNELRKKLNIIEHKTLTRIYIYGNFPRILLQHYFDVRVLQNQIKYSNYNQTEFAITFSCPATITLFINFDFHNLNHPNGITYASHPIWIALISQINNLLSSYNIKFEYTTYFGKIEKSLKYTISVMNIYIDSTGNIKLKCPIKYNVLQSIMHINQKKIHFIFDITASNIDSITNQCPNVTKIIDYLKKCGYNTHLCMEHNSHIKYIYKKQNGINNNKKKIKSNDNDGNSDNISLFNIKFDDLNKIDYNNLNNENCLENSSYNINDLNESDDIYNAFNMLGTKIYSTNSTHSNTTYSSSYSI